jgi:hypothetical protein
MKFTLYWLDGTRRVVEGKTIEAACTKAGYGAGAIKALDFYANGDTDDYVWNAKTHAWDPKKTPMEGNNE